MNTLKIHEQIAFLRKQKGLTQEELAGALGVTNQAVSKWESGQCCPDIQLLPALAGLFEISVDELLGCKPLHNINIICQIIKTYFTFLPEKESFEKVYRLAAQLHEVAVTDGYKKSIPWKEKDYSTDNISTWGFSLSSEPEGITGRTGSNIFFSCYDTAQPSPTISQLYDLSSTLSQFSDIQALKVMYTLYSSGRKDSDFHMTIGDGANTGQLNLYPSANYLTVDEIAALTRLTAKEVQDALKKLPLLTIEEQGKLCFRLDDSFCHVPALLMFLLQFA